MKLNNNKTAEPFLPELTILCPVDLGNSLQKDSWDFVSVSFGLKNKPSKVKGITRKLDLID